MKKKILISIAALLVLVLILGLLQALVVPKYITNPEGLLTGEYYADAGGHDVIFVGDCEVYESIVPSVLWEEYGITSYVRGGAQQLVWHSYALLEETFKYESPKAVVFNVYALKYDEPQSEAYNRMTFDTMRWSGAKLSGIFESMTEDESIVEYIFPLLRYHSRITELESEDFEYWLKSPEDVSDNGYLMKTGIRPMPESEPITDPPDELIPKRSFEYLDRMLELCKENGCELILMKAPTNPRGYWWYDEWDAQISEYAKEKGISYYNFIPEAEQMGIDWQTDTYDEGLHLNVYGAEKLTKRVGELLQKEHNISSRKADAETVERWDGYLKEYNDRKKQMEGN